MLKKLPGKPSNYPYHKPEENHPPGKDPTKKISNFIGKAASYAGSSKTKKPVQYIPTITNHTKVWWVPNVIVAHQKEGIEVAHLATGRTICKDAEFSRNFGRTSDAASLEVTAPILITRSDGHRHHKDNRGDVIFLTNRGEVTSYSPGLHGHDAIWQWRLMTDATWSNLPSPLGMMEAGQIVPTLKAFPLLAHDNRQIILAAGDQGAAFISPGGSIQIDRLPAPPTNAIICNDFSNNGITDLYRDGT